MSKLFLIIGFLLCYQGDTREFSWHENHDLAWTDFKGKPDQNSRAAAVTASGISFSYSIQKSSSHGITGFKTQVFAHFYPEHSWCKEELINPYILNHEQFHFNITELHVRKLRKNISKLKGTKFLAKRLSALHQEANANLMKMQKLYDAESNYSIHKEGQQKWVILVNKELKLLEQFKSQ